MNLPFPCVEPIQATGGTEEDWFPCEEQAMGWEDEMRQKNKVSSGMQRMTGSDLLYVTCTVRKRGRTKGMQRYPVLYL